MTGSPVPADRLGYNVSLDGGLSWEAPQVLPEDSGTDRNHQQLWVTTDGVHLAWRHGESEADPAGYLFSADFGRTWAPREIAIETGAVHQPYSLVADDEAVHLLTGPTDAMQYAYRRIQR